MAKRRASKRQDDPRLAPLIDELNRRKAELAVMIADAVTKGGIEAAKSPEIEARKHELTALSREVDAARQRYAEEG